MAQDVAADYGLPPEAEGKVDEVVRDLAEEIRAGQVTRTEVLVRLSDRMHALEENYPDVADGSTRTAIVGALDPVLEQAGMEKLVPWEW